MTYRPDNFIIQELVPKFMYDKFGERCWQLLDPRMLRGLQQLRDRFGPLVVNDWHTGGYFQQRGLRTWEFFIDDDEPIEYALELYASSRSQHKYGRGIDCHSLAYTADEMREEVISGNIETEFTAIESFPGMAWFHGDVRSVKPNSTSGYYIFG